MRFLRPWFSLRNPQLFSALQEKLADDKRLTLTAHRESDYYRELAAPTTGLIQGLGLLVGTIMALGAIAAAINSMQTALQARTREIATLRAIGFGRFPVLGAVLAECLVLSLLGAAVAVGLVYLIVDGNTFSAVAASTTSGAQVAFEFRVTAQAIVLAAALALSLGFIGGLIPGIAAIRKNLPTALRA